MSEKICPIMSRSIVTDFLEDKGEGVVNVKSSLPFVLCQQDKCQLWVMGKNENRHDDYPAHCGLIK